MLFKSCFITSRIISSCFISICSSNTQISCIHDIPYALIQFYNSFTGWIYSHWCGSAAGPRKSCSSSSASWFQGNYINKNNNYLIIVIIHINTTCNLKFNIEQVSWLTIRRSQGWCLKSFLQVMNCTLCKTPTLVLIFWGYARLVQCYKIVWTLSMPSFIPNLVDHTSWILFSRKDIVLFTLLPGRILLKQPNFCLWKTTNLMLKLQ